MLHRKGLKPGRRRQKIGRYSVLLALALCSLPPLRGNLDASDIESQAPEPASPSDGKDALDRWDPNLNSRPATAASDSACLMGSLSIPGESFNVAISGNYAYVANWDRGLQILNIADPAAPVKVGTFNTPHGAWSVQVKDSLCYVADAWGGLQIINVSSPSSPWRVGYYSDANRVYQSVHVEGGIAYVTSNYHEGKPLDIIDVSNPSTPVLLGRYSAPQIAEGLDVEDEVAYLAAAHSGLLVIDVHDPEFPRLLDNHPAARGAKDVKVAGGFAFVACSGLGLVIFDVSDPTNVRLVSRFDTPGYAFRVELSGLHAIVADHIGGVFVLDVSQPADPVPVAHFATQSPAYGVASDGEHVFVSEYVRFDILCASASCGGLCEGPTCGNGVIEPGEVCDDGNPWGGDGCDTTCNPDPPVCGNGFVDPGEECDVADLQAGESCDWNCRRGPLPKLEGCMVGMADLPSFALGLEIAYPYAYVAAYTAGLQIIDISDSTSPVIVGSHDTPYTAEDVCLHGSHAYVPDWNGGLQIIDVSTPSTPRVAGELFMPGAEMIDVVVDGNYAYVANHRDGSGLEIVDVTDVSRPLVLGRLPMPNGAGGVAKDSQYVYLAARHDGFLVVDVSDPTTPVVVGSYDTPGEARSIKLAGQLAYVADGYSGLAIVDITDPEHPTPVGAFDTQGFAFVVDLVGSKAYVADRMGGIVMIDVSNPHAPLPAGHCDTPGEAYGVATDGDLIYVGDFYLFDILSTDTTEDNPAELPECGNGVVESGEECDDGNPNANDGCTADCQYDVAICGNGVFNVGEGCDDGNLVGGDGCDAGCQLEPAVCGNGLLEPGEECDDGNLVSGDGCDASCTLQGVTQITLSVGTSNGNDTLIQGVPGSLLFKVEAPSTTQIAGFVFPMIYRFSNGNIIGPVEQGSGDAYMTFSPKAHESLELLSWNDQHGRRAGDPYYTLVGMTNMFSSLWTGSGELWRVTFLPLDTGVITIDRTNLPPSNYLSVLNPQGVELSIQWEPTIITVIPGLPTGNVNGDTLTNAADLIYLVNFLFREGPPPTPCEACGDVDCSGSVNTMDIIKAINYVFRDGQRPCNAGGLVNSTVWSCPQQP